MTIQTMDGLVAGLVNGTKLRLTVPSQTAEGAGTYHSLWKVAGLPGAGANPPAFSAGSGYVPTKATAGAFPFANPTSPARSYIASAYGVSSVAGGHHLYDRLWACSGFDTTVTTAQTVTTPGNLPSGRDPNAGLDVEPWLEVYTAPGATGATWTLTGVDAAGNTGRTWTYTHPANAESVGQMMPMVQGTAATLGCRQVTSLTCSVSSGTAGNVGITLLRRLLMLPASTANIPYQLSATQLGLPRVYDDACLASKIVCTTTGTGMWVAEFILAQG